MEKFSVTRIYSDENGESRFEDILIAMNDAGDIWSLSEALAVNSMIFREVELSYDYYFHHVPQRRHIVLLDGGIEKIARV